MGRPRKPEPLRRLHGDRPDRFNNDAPVPLFAEPEIPDGMSEAQREEWTKVTGWLRSMHMLHAADGPTIEAYVTVTEKLDRLRIRMTSEPEIVRNPSNGMPMQNPVFDQWLKACTKMESLATKLGLHPSARSGIRQKNAQVKPGSSPGSSDRLFGV